MLWVAEHGRIYRGSESRILPEGNLALASEDFDDVLGLLESEEGPEFGPVFTFQRVGGHDALKARNWVGVVRTSNDAQFEILPKVAKDDGAESCRARLVRMLRELREPVWREAAVASLEAEPMDLFELLFRFFLEQVSQIVRRGIARTYVERAGNLIYLRGKLKLSEHIRRNAAHGAAFYCEYDEYEMDRPANRLLRGALDVVLRLTRDSDNQQRCRELLFWFDAVPPTPNARLDEQRIRQERSILHYGGAIATSLLILKRMNPMTRTGGKKAIAMLFPMERIWEDYVEAMLRARYPDWHIETQVHGGYLIDDHGGRTRFQLRPDFRLSKDGQVIIADAKWKLLDPSRDNYGITQSDLYQLYAYSGKSMPGGEKELWLVYPQTDEVQGDLEPLWFEAGRARVEVRVFG